MRFKMLCIGLSLILITSTRAFGVTCFQPQSGELISLHKSEVDLILRYTNGRGYNAIRQFEGPVSENDIPMIQMQTQGLRQLGPEFEVSIPLAGCVFSKTPHQIFRCSGESKIGGTELTLSSLAAYTVTQDHVDSVFKLQNFRMMIGQSDVFFFTLSIPSQNCTGEL